jgi:hypothetical protein
MSRLGSKKPAVPPERNVNIVRNRIRNDRRRISEQFRKPEYSSPDELLFAIDEYIRTQPDCNPEDPTNYYHPFYDLQEHFEPYWQRLNEVFTGFVSTSFYNFILVDCADYLIVSKFVPTDKGKETIVDEQTATIIEEDEEDIRVNVANETTLQESDEYPIKSWYKCPAYNHKFTKVLEGDASTLPQQCEHCLVQQQQQQQHQPHRLFPYKQRYEISRDQVCNGRTLHDIRRCIHCRTFDTLCLPSVYNPLSY